MTMLRGRTGFTLLEMVLVLLIMGIVFAMVIPSIGTLGRDPEEGQSWKQLADLLRSSRVLALENGVTVKLVLDPVTGNYRVDSTGARGAGLVEEGQLDVGLNMTIIADSTRAKFSFRPDGSAFSDSLIMRASGYATKVSVDPFTGEVKIEDR
jgi:prepilin-type N-terminal cleavage/methylation domain-containing protein